MKFFQKTLILAFEANSAAGCGFPKIALFSDSSPLCIPHTCKFVISWNHKRAALYALRTMYMQHFVGYILGLERTEFELQSFFEWIDVQSSVLEVESKVVSFIQSPISMSGFRPRIKFGILSFLEGLEVLCPFLEHEPLVRLIQGSKFHCWGN